STANSRPTGSSPPSSPSQCPAEEVKAGRMTARRRSKRSARPCSASSAPRPTQPKASGVELALSADGRDARQLRVLHFRRLAMLDEVLERGECPGADPVQLVGDQRLEQSRERPASQDHLGLTHQ